MTPGDTARVLALIQSRDQRTVGETDVYAWHQDIGDLDYEDCAAAVSDHFKTSEVRIMPVHVRRFAVERRRDRLSRQQARAAIEAADRPGVMAPGEFHAQLAEVIDAARRAKVRRQQDARRAVEAVAGCTCKTITAPTSLGRITLRNTKCPVHPGEVSA